MASIFPFSNTSGDLCQSFTDDRFGTNPGDYRHPELPADPGHDVKHEALKTIIDHCSTEVPNHMRSPWPKPSGDLCQSFTDDRFGTSPGDYRHPELDVEHEELKTQAVTTITTEPGRIRYLWSVDAKKLESSDKQIASPDCEHGAAIFIMRIGATQVSMNKGGASFKRSEGKGHVAVKCLQGAADRQVRYQLWIGRRIDACTTRPGREDRKIVEHNFTRSASSGLPKGEEEWDFKSFVEPGSNTFVVCLEIFTDDDFAAGGA